MTRSMMSHPAAGPWDHHVEGGLYFARHQNFVDHRRIANAARNSGSLTTLNASN
jgi:hypothetical protein